MELLFNKTITKVKSTETTLFWGVEFKLTQAGDFGNVRRNGADEIVLFQKQVTFYTRRRRLANQQGIPTHCRGGGDYVRRFVAKPTSVGIVPLSSLSDRKRKSGRMQTLKNTHTRRKKKTRTRERESLRRPSRDHNSFGIEPVKKFEFTAKVSCVCVCVCVGGGGGKVSIIIIIIKGMFLSCKTPECQLTQVGH